MIPGSTIATRTLNGFASCANDSLSASNANFDAVYAAMGELAMRPATDATLTMQPLRRAHRRQHRLDAADRAEVVRLHGGPELGQRQFLDRADALNPCVVDEHVDWSALLHDAADSFRDGRIGINIHGRNRDGQLLLGGDARELGRSMRSAHRRRDLVASSPEGQGGGHANSRAGSCDKDGCHGWSSSRFAPPEAWASHTTSRLGVQGI